MGLVNGEPGGFAGLPPGRLPLKRVNRRVLAQAGVAVAVAAVFQAPRAVAAAPQTGLGQAPGWWRSAKRRLKAKAAWAARSLVRALARLRVAAVAAVVLQSRLEQRLPGL